MAVNIFIDDDEEEEDNDDDDHYYYEISLSKILSRTNSQVLLELGEGHIYLSNVFWKYLWRRCFSIKHVVWVGYCPIKNIYIVLNTICSIEPVHTFSFHSLCAGSFACSSLTVMVSNLHLQVWVSYHRWNTMRTFIKLYISPYKVFSVETIHIFICEPKCPGIWQGFGIQ